MEGRRITGFETIGHSGYAPAGKDIVCAAITSAVRLVECVLNDVMGLSAPVSVNEKNTHISLRLPRSLEPSADSTCQILLTGMMSYLCDLRNEYPDYLEVLETP